jgi:tetratricopeptide (TPR) repeat protein
LKATTKQSKEISDKLENDVIRAAILHQLGNVHFKKREFQAALNAYNNSLDIKCMLTELHNNELYKISKGVTMAQIGKTWLEMGSRSKALPYLSQQQQKKALSYIWRAHLLFENRGFIYYNMTKEDLQTIRDRDDVQYETMLSEIESDQQDAENPI